MQKLFIKITLIVLLAFLFVIAIGLRFRNGYIDPFYLRFATPQANSLIVGTSRAAQGIQPEILDKLLNNKIAFTPPLFNFSFTVGHSRYGPAYYQLIQQKLNPETENGLFIVTVDPWSLSVNKKKPNFPENKLFTAKMHTVTGFINFEYIFNYYPLPYYAAFAPQDTFMRLHTNGWLEVSPPSISDNYIANRISESVRDNRSSNLIYDTLSTKRVAYLKQTMGYLQKHGKVILVRIPVPSEMLELEREFAPEFDSLMLRLATQAKLPYLNYSNYSNNFKFIDGHHLYKESGKKFSRMLAKDIIMLQETTGF